MGIPLASYCISCCFTAPRPYRQKEVTCKWGGISDFSPCKTPDPFAPCLQNMPGDQHCQSSRAQEPFSLPKLPYPSHCCSWCLDPHSTTNSLRARVLHTWDGDSVENKAMIALSIDLNALESHWQHLAAGSPQTASSTPFSRQPIQSMVL